MCRQEGVLLLCGLLGWGAPTGSGDFANLSKRRTKSSEGVRSTGAAAPPSSSWA